MTLRLLVLITRNIMVAVLILPLVCGCTTLTPLSLDGTVLSQELRPGDTVRVLTRDGNESEFEVRQVNTEQIEGEDQTVPISNIVRIEQRKISLLKTGGVVAGTVIVVIAALAIVVLAAGPPPISFQ